MPSATPPKGCQPTADVIGFITAGDLARVTGDSHDQAAAREWVGYANEALRRAIEPMLQAALRRRGLLK